MLQVLNHIHYTYSYPLNIRRSLCTFFSLLNKSFFFNEKFRWVEFLRETHQGCVRPQGLKNTCKHSSNKFSHWQRELNSWSCIWVNFLPTDSTFIDWIRDYVNCARATTHLTILIILFYKRKCFYSQRKKKWHL